MFTFSEQAVTKNTVTEEDQLADGDKKQGPGYKAPAVHKAFELVRTVAQSQQGLGIKDLAQKLGYSKSTTHGLVHALLREGVLTRGPGGRKLSLGPTIAELAFANWNQSTVTKLAQPILNSIRDTINETVILGVRIRNRVLIIATAEATEFLKISALVGSTIPLLGGAVGKAFLAEEALSHAAAFLAQHGLPEYTERSITDVREYLSELERVRSQGYAVDIEEYLQGIRAVAVALGNRSGLAAALWVVGISASMDEQSMRKISEIVTGEAQRLRCILDTGSRDAPT
ncbi:MAG: IclR family transcriptional regulator [Desulfovermiculus sp.]